MNASEITARLLALYEKKRQLSNEINTDLSFLNRLKNSNSPSCPSINTIEKERDYLVFDNQAKKIDIKEYFEYRKKVSDILFYEKIKEEINKIPESNGSRYFLKPNIKIGIIADEFLYNSFKGVADLYYITPRNYRQYKGQLDILLIVSTWSGLNEEWRGLSNKKNTEIINSLKSIIDTFRNDDTKIVFYSKEDPVNYDVFIHIAKLCDYILTTEQEVVEKYKKDCGHEHVGVLRFGVNPLYHNPIGMKNTKRKREVLFAGSWYKKYPERQKDTKMIFDGVLQSGNRLKIIDRNYDYSRSDNYMFPVKYLPYISPSVPHHDLQKIHKLFDWAINLNSIKYSHTMFANRVYELLALGNIVLSNYNTAINEILPSVFLINDAQEIGEIMNSYGDEDIYKHQLMGIRIVFRRETTFHRINELMEFVGIMPKQRKNKVAVIVEEKNPVIIEAFNRQSYQEKILVTESELNNDNALKDCSMITFFHKNHLYEEYYLEDMINGFKYTNCNYVTKDSYYHGNTLVQGIEHNYVSRMKSKYRTVFWKEAFDIFELISLDGERDIPNGYSIDHFEYNEVIPSKEINNIDGKHELSLIVAVYNNGLHLYNKCFMSLMRSSIFDRMEIILVDDGSTDEETINIVKRLERQYKNVRTYFFPKGGSGSASRPRNKGIELATTPFIAFLDPDNEAVNDGYAKLLREIKYDTDCDMVVGNMIKLDNDRQSLFNIYEKFYKHSGSNVIVDGRQFLIDTQMTTHSIQTLIVKKEVLINNNLKMVNFAAGEDTIFFQELLLYSKKIKAIDLVIHLYYAAVSSSVTNNITKRFYEKHLIIEQYRIQFLKKHQLLSTYMNNKFNYYFINWYLKRLTKLRNEDVVEAIDVLFEIYKLYKPYISRIDKKISKFEKMYNRGQYSKIINLYQ